MGIRNKSIIIQLGITLRNSLRKHYIVKKALKFMPNGKLMLNPFLVVFDVRRVHGRGKQAVATEIGFIFISMNLTKLAKNLASKTSTIQKPHSVSFSLIIFKTGITVWFYLEASFCQPFSLFCFFLVFFSFDRSRFIGSDNLSDNWMANHILG